MADLWLSKKIDLRIKEAKNLNGEIDLFNLLGVMNAQCKISVDSADLCETSTVESDNPLWGYKNVFDITSEFNKMKITIYDEQEKKEYGNVLISMKELNTGVKGWYSIQPIQPKRTGKVLLQFKYYKPKGENGNHSISVTVMKAVGLGDGLSEAPASQAVLHLIPNLVSHTTAIKLNDSNPEFMEYFSFFKEILNITKIYISLWDPVVFSTNICESSLGYACFPVSELVEKGPTWQTWLDLNDFDTLPAAATDASSTIINLIRNQEKRKFTCDTGLDHNFKKSSIKNIICPGCRTKINRNSVTCSHCLVSTHHSCIKSSKECPGLGMIYLDIKYDEHKILPLKFYNPFIEFLFQDNFALPQYLEGLPEDRDETLAIMTRLLDSKGKTIDFLKVLIQQELLATNQTQTLFRSNSYATKNIDIYMKLHGQVFMKTVLESMLVFIRSPDVNCELDPDRLSKSDKLTSNIANLERCCEIFLGDLLKNIHLIPLGMRDLFIFIRTTVVDKFGATKISGYTSIGSFLFLRFFGPALVSPNNFGLIEGDINAKTRRNLILVAKTIQNLSNFVKFGAKEPYMKVMNDFMQKTHSNLELIIDLITTSENHVPKFIARVSSIELACDADEFIRALIEAEKSNQFLKKFSRKTDILLLLRSLERKKDVLNAKIKSNMISPKVYTSVNSKKLSLPPPRQSSASWKPPKEALEEIPETAGIEFDEKPEEIKKNEKRHSPSKKITMHGDVAPRWSLVSDEHRDSYRLSAISMLSSISDLDAELEPKEGNKTIFATLTRRRT